MPDLPTAAELRSRIAECAASYGGSIPRDAGLVWDGYLAALLEWGLLSVADHADLCDLLPELPTNPVLGVFLGWDRDAWPS